ncbi:MAG: hypothetical protein WBA74_01675 [Cyclobacteriaceae bacterium]
MLKIKYLVAVMALSAVFLVTSCSDEEVAPTDITDANSAIDIDPDFPPFPDPDPDPVPIVVPPAASWRLVPGEQLFRGQFRTSRDGRFKLILQTDGNLVLYQGSLALWNSATHYRGVVRAAMQTDGNLVLYDNANRAKWATNTSGRAGSWLNIQNDGNVVLYRNNVPQWQTFTCCR